MTEVKFKIGQMNEAVDRFRRAGHNIDLSIQRVHLLIQTLEAQLPELVGQYHSQRAFMEQWSAVLIEFAGKLDGASEDLRLAMEQSGTEFAHIQPPPALPPHLLASHLHDQLLREILEDVPIPEPATPAPPDNMAIDAYLSETNRPLYDSLIEERAHLTAQEAQLDTLIAERGRLVEDLEALENRIMAFEGTQTVSTVPRLEVLRGQITVLDTQIDAMQGTIDGIRDEVGQMVTRLERIALPEGADLGLVMSLENGETAEIVVQNTEGCVNHVVTRAPVPTNLARDAHLWDDIVRDNPELGIRIGDQPLVGSIIVMEAEHSFADDVNGHLLYVERIEGDQVWVTDNNNPDEAVLLNDLTDELDGENIHYLYLPWHTQA